MRTRLPGGVRWNPSAEAGLPVAPGFPRSSEPGGQRHPSTGTCISAAAGGRSPTDLEPRVGGRRPTVSQATLAGGSHTPVGQRWAGEEGGALGSPHRGAWSGPMGPLSSSGGSPAPLPVTWIVLEPGLRLAQVKHLAGAVSGPTGHELMAGTPGLPALNRHPRQASPGAALGPTTTPRKVPVGARQGGGAWGQTTRGDLILPFPAALGRRVSWNPSAGR